MRTLCVVITAMIASVGAVHAKPWNVDIFMGTGVPDTLRWDGVGAQTDAGDVFGFAVSRDDVFGSHLEIGAELSRAKAEYTNDRPSNISGTALMATAKVNFVNNDGFSAYAGAGLGVVDVKYTNQALNYDNAEFEFAGQLTLGVRFAISPKTGLFVEGRYIRSKDAQVAYNPATRDADFRSKAIVLGVRKEF